MIMTKGVWIVVSYADSYEPYVEVIHSEQELQEKIIEYKRDPSHGHCYFAQVIKEIVRR